MAGAVLVFVDFGQGEEANPGATRPGDVTEQSTPDAGSGSAPTTESTAEQVEAAPSAGGEGATVAPAGAATLGQGTAVIVDDRALSDAITFQMTGVTPPREGKEYVAWLISDDWSVKNSTGPMTYRQDGTIEHTFDHNSNRYSGENLIELYSKVMVTEEDLGVDPGSATGEPLFVYELPLSAMTHIRLLMSSFPPDGKQGILADLRTQLRTALFHAKLASAANSMLGVKQHSEHVVNIIEGTEGPNFGDLVGNGVVENPGDGKGVLAYLADREHALFSARLAPGDAVISEHAANLVSYAKNAEDLAIEVRDRALKVFETDELDVALSILSPGERDVAGLLEVALSGTGPDMADGVLQAYIEGQLMATYSLAPVVGDMVTAPTLRSITYGLSEGRVYRVDARERAVPEDVSLAMDGLSEGTKDAYLNVSSDGRWMVLATDRFDPECKGLPCLALVPTDLVTGGAVRVGAEQGRLVRPEPGSLAVSSGGDLVVYQAEGVVSTHSLDLLAILRKQDGWGTPTLLTGESKFPWNMNPALSGDASRLLFECGDQEQIGHSICEVGADGQGFSVVLTPADSPPGGPSAGSLRNPDYALDGGVVFSADWDGVSVWHLAMGKAAPTIVGGDHRRPCVFSDGKIAVVFEDRSTGGPLPDIHIRLMEPKETGFITVAVLQGVGEMAGGLGCGG